MQRLSFFFLSAFFLFLTACEPEDYEFGDITAPQNLALTVEVVGATADNPGGDGSGLVRLTATGDNVITYRFEFTDGTMAVAPGGRLDKRFSAVGTNTYGITLIATGTAGIATTLTDEVTVTSTFSDDEALQALTGGDSKTWYWAADEPGHLGVGQNDDNAGQNYFANFYQAVPFEKDGPEESRCLYQDELEFSLVGGELFYQLRNFGQTYFNVAYESVGGGGNGFDYCYDFAVNEDAQRVTLGPAESVVVDNGVAGQTRGTALTFTDGGFMSYYIGATTYEIISLTDNRLVVRAVQGNDPGLAWYHIFSATKPSPDGGGEEPEYNSLVFSDEFNADGAPDPAKWSYNTGRGDNGWGNGEAQFYTDRPENVRVEGGNLVITARREAFGGADFTSARLLTENKFEFTYGRMEFRAKLPSGGGTWPALWLLGEDYATNTWPACGEIDVMEHVGNRQNTIFSSLHYPGNFAGDAVTRSINDADVSDEFHVYSAIWSPNTIRFFVDGELYHTFRNDGNLPFNDDFFLIMNVAMGGNFGGAIAPDFQSSSMEVDYVRVYQ